MRAEYIVTVRHEYAVLVRADSPETAARRAKATQRGDYGREVEVVKVERASRR